MFGCVREKEKEGEGETGFVCLLFLKKAGLLPLIFLHGAISDRHFIIQ